MEPVRYFQSQQTRVHSKSIQSSSTFTFSLHDTNTIPLVFRCKHTSIVSSWSFMSSSPLPAFCPFFVQVENQTSSTISTPTSSSFYTILLISLLCIGISCAIFWNYRRGQRDHSDKKHFDSQRSFLPSSFLPFLGNFLNPALSSLAFWQWVWNWTYKLLRLIGFAPRWIPET